MSERKKQIFLEALKKAKKESVMGKLANGDTDPMEPWSKKHAPLDEVNTQVLWKFIKAMGRDPRTISLNDRLNLARTDRFKKFARDHVKLIQQQKEEVEQIDEISAETKASYKEKAKAQVKELQPHAKGEYGDIAKRMIARRKKGIKMASEEKMNEMDKSAPQPGRDGKISHSTYGSRDKEGSDYFKGKESPVKPISVKQMKKDALDILKKQGVAEETEKKYYAIVHKTSKKVHSTYRNLDTAKHVYRQMDKDLRPHLTVMATSNPGDIKEKTVNEAGTGTLMSYIKSKGLNPLSMDGNQKNKYSQSSEFKLFKHRKMKAETSGMGERGEDWNEEKKPVKEAVDEKDTVTLDIPLMIRIVEYAREDAKTDMDLHRIVENLINLRHEGVLTMDHYDQIVNIKKMKEGVEQIDELKKQSDTQDLDSHITREDLRKWFSKTDPEGGWKRINSKGEAIGPCAREPGEPKPKCMSNEKRAKLSKKERAAAVAAKRKHDPVADRPGKGGKPVNVSNFGKGKISKEDLDEACWSTHKQVGMKKKGDKMVPDCVPKNEEVELIDEKNVPTNPKLWSRAKALARSKFDVYPSAYANGWASKWYKSKGGGWKTAKEEVEHVSEGIYGIEDSPLSATNSVKAMESKMAKEKSKSARIIKAIYKKKGIKETLYDWEKSEKGNQKDANAKIILKGGKTMTGKDRDVIEIDPVVRTKLNGLNGTKPNV